MKPESDQAMRGEDLKIWFVFGEDSDGTVDIADVDSDVAVHLPRDVAECIIERHNQEIERAAEALDAMQ